MSTSEPLLTVVSNVHDDEHRLPRAVASVLAAWDADVAANVAADGLAGVDAGGAPVRVAGLEVLVVDDGSTDGTYEVAERLAAADPRVRVVRRERSDGAPGAPRNLGLENARGTFVAFCDSDDEYLPGALRRLVDLAVAEDADVAAGGVARFNERTGRTTPLAATAYVAGPVEPLGAGSPLWQDTIAVAKVVRRSLLEEHRIRFPEGILYEDQPFTVALWARARRVATLADTVYLWYVNNVAGQESITARRHEIANFHDRVAANRAIDGYLAGRTELEAAKLDKFVRHDLALYGKDLDARDDAYRADFLATARGYLAGVPTPLRSTLEQPFRLVVRELVDGTDEGAVAACLFAYRRLHLDRPLVRRGGRWSWPYRAGDEAGPDHDLDGLVEAEHRRGRVLVTTVARSVEVVGDDLRIGGTVVVGDGTREARSRVRLELVDRDTARVVASVVAAVRQGRFAVSLPVVGLVDREPATLDLRATATRPSRVERVLVRLRLRRRPAAARPVEQPADGVLPDLVAGLQPYRTRNGNLSLRPVPSATPSETPSAPSASAPASTPSGSDA